jgi:hypothetical protein
LGRLGGGFVCDLDVGDVFVEILGEINSELSLSLSAATRAIDEINRCGRAGGKKMHGIA